eukprot:GHVN01090015.1.p1 GENE.GHVN01090015.1~~GHVN01090015.1.p1  ORF type:complete len:312 (+),score=29.27 GHVN01090015.1:731-1666(+)
MKRSAQFSSSPSLGESDLRHKLELYNENLCRLSQFVSSLVQGSASDIQWSPYLTDILKEIANSGMLRYPWHMVKMMWSERFEMILNEIIKKTGKHPSKDEKICAQYITVQIRRRQKAPFTIQRLAELALTGERKFAIPGGRSPCGKFIFAVARNVNGIETSLEESIPLGCSLPETGESLLRALDEEILGEPYYSVTAHQSSRYTFSTAATPISPPSSIASSSSSTPLNRKLQGSSRRTFMTMRGAVSKLYQSSSTNEKIGSKRVSQGSRSIKKPRGVDQEASQEGIVEDELMGDDGAQVEMYHKMTSYFTP